MTQEYVSDDTSKTTPICTEKVLFLTDHKVSLEIFTKVWSMQANCKVKFVFLEKRL